MTTLSSDTSMRALLMRPHAELSSTDTDLLKSLLVTAAQAVEEAEMHERVSATAASDPMLAKAILLNEIEGTSVHDAHYPMARKRIADQLDVMIAAEQDASVLARRLVEARDAFHRSPGTFLPGAEPADGVAFLGRAHDMDGWVLVDGQTVLWVFASAGVGKATVFEVSQYLRYADGVDRAIVVGSHIKENVVLPDAIRFVPLAIDTQAANAGRRAWTLSPPSGPPPPRSASRASISARSSTRASSPSALPTSPASSATGTPAT